MQTNPETKKTRTKTPTLEIVSPYKVGPRADRYKWSDMGPL